jgi:hypothetical protein
MPSYPKLDYMVGYRVESVKEHEREGEGIGIHFVGGAKVVSTDARFTGEKADREITPGLVFLRWTEDYGQIHLYFGRVTIIQGQEEPDEMVVSVLDMPAESYRLSHPLLTHEWYSNQDEEDDEPEDPSAERVATGPDEEWIKAEEDKLAAAKKRFEDSADTVQQETTPEDTEA